MTPFSVPTSSGVARARSSGPARHRPHRRVIDSRTARRGDAFFAIRATTRTVTRFVEGARTREVGAVVVRHPAAEVTVLDDFPVVLVGDTTLALQRLGAFHRRRHSIPLVRDHGIEREDDHEELTAGVLAVRLRILRRREARTTSGGAPHACRDRAPARGGRARVRHERLRGDRSARPAGPAHHRGGDDDQSRPPRGRGSIEGVQKAKGELWRRSRATGW